MLAEGDKAPDFTLPDQNGEKVKLSDLKGKQPALADLSDAVKINFTEADQDYRWRLVNVLPFSLRRIREAEASMSWEP